MALDIRPTQRRLLSRVATYVVFAAFIVLLLLTANWPRIGQFFFNLDVARHLWPGVLRAAFNTIWYTAFCFFGGLILAVILALLKMGTGPFKWFAIVFIEIFRGLPAVLTLLIFAFAIPIGFSVRFPGGTIGAGLLGLLLVTGAYSSEVIRAGIVAVPKGQWEAARSLGMTNLRTTLTVILPQAIRIVIPPLTNEMVLLLKDTSLLYVVGATVMTKELTLFARDGMTTYSNPTPYIVVAAFYLLITIPMTSMVARLEKKMAVKK